MPTVPYTSPHPAAPRPSDGAGPRRARRSPFAPAPAPSASRPGWVGGADLAGLDGQPGSKPQPRMLCRGRRTGGRPRSLGRGWGGVEEEPSAQPPQPRAEAQAPLCGQRVLPPFSAGLPFSSPAPMALPRATAPAAGGAKLTYLEPDKQEPLGHGSQSPPRVTGAATANGRRCQEPLRPIQLLAGLRAPSRPQPMGTSGRRAPAARPQPPPPPPPRRRGAADWPGSPRGGTRALGLMARADWGPRARRVKAWCFGRRPVGPLPGSGGVPRSSCLSCSLRPCSPLLSSRRPLLWRWE